MLLLNLYQESRIKKVAGVLAGYQQQLSQPDNKGVNTQIEEVLAGSKRLETLLASKVNWGRFYTLLNGVTPKNVKVNTVALTQDGAVKIDGQAESLPILAQAIVAWRDGAVGKPTPLSNLTLASNGYAVVDGKRVVSFSVTGQADLSKLK